MHQHHDKSCGCGHDHHQDHDHDKNCGCGHDHHHDHDHDKNCGCGHDYHHDHDHDKNCGCGHDHHHEHGENCGCGHHHEPLPIGEAGVSEQQADALLAIHQRGYLPIARFVLASSKDENAYAVAMSPVYIADAGEDIDSIKASGTLFASLENMGLITLDYDMPLKGYAYKEYEEAKVYAYFVESVKEAAQKPGFLLDTPLLELGSMALTEEGYSLLKGMMEKA